MTTAEEVARQPARNGLMRRLRDLRHFGSIRSKISFYLLLVSVVPILVLSFSSYYSAKREIRHQLLEHLEGVVSLKSEAIERWYLDRRTQILLIRETPDLQSTVATLLGEPFESRRDDPGYRHLDRALRLHTEHGQIFREIFLMDTRGKIWYSTEPGSEGLLKGNRPYFAGGMKGLFLQNMYHSLTLRGTTSTFALPVKEGGRVVAVLAFRLEDGRLGEIMEVYAGIEAGGQMYLVNNYNYFVTNPAGRSGYAMERVSYSEPVQRCLAQRGEAGEYANHDDRQVLTAFTYLSDYRLCVVAELASDVAYNEVDGFRFYMVGVSVMTLGVVTLIAFWLSSSISRPVRELTEVTAVAASGNLDQHIAFGLRDELGTLASSFNTMIASLKARTDELTRMNEDLEEFSYIISHDLKEPLRSVSGFMDLLRKRCGDQLDDKGRKYVDRAIAASNRMRQLIDDLLSYSRLAAQSREPVRVDTGALVEDVIVSLTDAIEKSAARVEVGELPEVHGEPVLLTTLVQNLIANAIKFRGDEPPEIHITAERDDLAWRFSIEDNGIGIEPQYADRIYKMFQRLHPRSQYPGTGIGLAVCKKIVEHHGGRIWFESRPGGGTTFHFTIAD